MSEQEKKKRGTAAMSPEARFRAQSSGGKTTSQNRAHMAEIGRRGGQATSQNREHMSAIGKKGGSAPRRTE